MESWRHARAVVLLPGMVLVVIPVLTIVFAKNVQPGWGADGALSALPLFLGSVLVAVGLLLMQRTIRLLAKIGHGTLAPWDPTSRLVVAGPYRYVRNPMITGVFSVLLGEATLLGSWPIAVWLLLFICGTVTVIRFVEEPQLVDRFGDEYLIYRANVPAWIPRIRPW